MNKHAVISRIGKDSCFSSWLNLEYSKRNWDLYLVFYDNESFKKFTPEDGVKKFYIKGGKLTGIHSFLKNENILDNYNFFWIPDDDIEIDSESINEMFNLMIAHNIEVGQPSLTIDSYFTYLLLIQNTSFKIRYSNFVEIMAPCLKKNVLEKCLSDFEEAFTGFGIDFLWSHYAEEKEDNIAIFDSISMKHTRPVGGPIYKELKKNNLDQMEELRSIFKKYNQKQIRPFAYKAIDSNDIIQENRFILGYRTIIYFLKNFKMFLDRRKLLNKIFKLAKYYFIYRIKVK